MIDAQRRASCETSRLHYRLVINGRVFAFSRLLIPLCVMTIRASAWNTRCVRSAEQRRSKLLQRESHRASITANVDGSDHHTHTRLPAKMRKPELGDVASRAPHPRNASRSIGGITKEVPTSVLAWVILADARGYGM